MSFTQYGNVSPQVKVIWLVFELAPFKYVVSVTGPGATFTLVNELLNPQYLPSSGTRTEENWLPPLVP